MLLNQQAEKPTDNKRLRMERDALENLLFGLFEKQSTWGFVQLQRETDQPAPWLKVHLLPCSLLMNATSALTT
jgi:TFIIF, beta subunit HTH domain